MPGAACGVLALLSGCVGVAGLMGASVDAYEGPKKTDSEVAKIVRTKSGTSDGVGFLTKVDGVVYGDDLLRGFPSKVNVLPGQHQITVKCIVGRRYAFPSFTAYFEAGRHYELVCKDMGNGYASARYIDHGINPPP